MNESFNNVVQPTKRYPLEVDYKFKLTNYDLLHPHSTLREKFELCQKINVKVPVDQSNVIILRCPENDKSKCNIYSIKMHQRRLSRAEFEEIVEQSAEATHKIHHESPKQPQGLYSSKTMWYNSHYGKLIKNVTSDIEIDFTIESTDLQNLELDSDISGHGNVFTAKLLPG